MRLPTVALTAALMSLPEVAAADPALDLSDLPQGCRVVTEIPRSARIADPALSARVSAATCDVDIALKGVPLADNDSSIQAVNSAIRPIIATLDQVATKGGAKWQMIALYMKGDILSGLETRLRGSIPSLGPRVSLEAALDIERRHSALDQKLERWETGATAAFRRVTDLARANPSVATADPVMQYMVRDATSYVAMAPQAQRINRR